PKLVEKGRIYEDARYDLWRPRYQRAAVIRARRRVREAPQPFGQVVRAGLRHSLELCMNARALTTDVLLGIVPIALAIALWQAISSFGYAPVTLLPPPGLVFQRLAQQLLTGSFQHAIAATL